MGASDYLVRSNVQSSDAIRASKSINRVTHVADYGRVEQSTINHQTTDYATGGRGEHPERRLRGSH
jgi:hypothetical protein